MWGGGGSRESSFSDFSCKRCIRWHIWGSMEAIFKYCSSVFYNSLYLQYQQRIRRLQKRAANNTARLHKSTTCDAATVIACMAPLLAVRERSVFWLVKQWLEVSNYRHLLPLSAEDYPLPMIAELFRDATLHQWQQDWVESSGADRTHDIIPKVQPYVESAFSWRRQFLDIAVSAVICRKGRGKIMQIADAAIPKRQLNTYSRNAQEQLLADPAHPRRQNTQPTCVNACASSGMKRRPINNAAAKVKFYNVKGSTYGPQASESKTASP